MASAIGMSPLDCPPSYAWLTPRLSFTRDTTTTSKDPPRHSTGSDPNEDPDPQPDFEFHLEDPVVMLPADQLFSDGKLVPLHLKPSATTGAVISQETSTVSRRPDPSDPRSDPYLFSPKAPRCSSRWKELLGLRKLYQSTNNATTTTTKTTSSTNKSLKHFLHRNTKTPSFSSENAPLLKEHSDSETLSLSSSRLSLSSSSSSHDHDDLPRLSLDSDKPNPNPISLHRNPNPNHPRIRLVKSKPNSIDSNHNANHKTTSTDPYNRVGRSPIRLSTGESGAAVCRGVSVDSPRMNSSGKIVFQSLERSSSSPSSFNGGPRFKHRGMERSYSANVRVTPVLNVPVCSLRSGSKSGSVFGFGQLFSSPQKKDGNGGGGGARGYQHGGGRNRSDRS